MVEIKETNSNIRKGIHTTLGLMFEGHTLGEETVGVRLEPPLGTEHPRLLVPTVIR